MSPWHLLIWSFSWSQNELLCAMMLFYIQPVSPRYYKKFLLRSRKGQNKVAVMSFRFLLFLLVQVRTDALDTWGSAFKVEKVPACPSRVLKGSSVVMVGWDATGWWAGCNGCGMDERQWVSCQIQFEVRLLWHVGESRLTLSCPFGWCYYRTQSGFFVIEWI